MIDHDNFFQNVGLSLQVRTVPTQKTQTNLINVLQKLKLLDTLIIIGGIYLVSSKMFNVSFNTSSNTNATVVQSAIMSENAMVKKVKNVEVKKEIAVSFKNTSTDADIIEILPTKKPAMVNPKNNDAEVANLFTNVSALYSKNLDLENNKSKREKCNTYVARFIGVAKIEREKFGIPISIILAQGLLESDAGDSKLSQKANNHFGVKTFSNSVPHVTMRDDSPHDKFKKYNSAWESYRDHSLLLLKNHYQDLQYLSKTDYVGWAKGLQKAGYATDVEYSKKLIALIENLKLYRLDEV